MIRPSVLLKHALENDGRMRVGIAFGQHGEEVAAGYQQRAPVRMIYDAEIRRFQASFETLVVHDISSAAKFLDRTEEDASKAIREMRKTGLGPLCRNPCGKPGNEGRVCTSVDCWDDCPQMLFIAQPDLIAALQVWQTSLRNCQGDWERDHPERWEKVWLPWLCFADVAEEKMVRGPLIKAWNAGTTVREQLESQAGFVPPAPW
jgi:hypothetical protein